jgi:hypothetical protein
MSRRQKAFTTPAVMRTTATAPANWFGNACSLRGGLRVVRPTTERSRNGSGVALASRRGPAVLW